MHISKAFYAIDFDYKGGSLITKNDDLLYLYFNLQKLQKYFPAICIIHIEMIKWTWFKSLNIQRISYEQCDDLP